MASLSVLYCLHCMFPSVTTGVMMIANASLSAHSVTSLDLPPFNWLSCWKLNSLYVQILSQLHCKHEREGKIESEREIQKDNTGMTNQYLFLWQFPFLQALSRCCYWAFLWMWPRFGDPEPPLWRTFRRVRYVVCDLWPRGGWAYYWMGIEWRSCRWPHSDLSLSGLHGGQ